MSGNDYRLIELKEMLKWVEGTACYIVEDDVIEYLNKRIKDIEYDTKVKKKIFESAGTWVNDR